MVFTGNSICLRCFYEMNPRYFRWKIGSVHALAIYPYDQTFQSMLYQYKGCGDIELAPVFLERVSWLLKIRYWNYYVVPAPSHASHVEARGFDHVPLAFSGIGRKLVHAIEKTEDVKQSDQTKEGRRSIGKHLRLLPNTGLAGKRILFVDDVYTTGSTARACLKLLRSLHPRKLAVVVLSSVAENRGKG